MYGLYVVMIPALVLCNYCLAEWNVTGATAGPNVTSCHHHGDGNNCTVNTEDDELNGHFSKCPEKYEHYCIHGECRYVTEQKEPSCKCMEGFIGSRCEYLIIEAPQIGPKQRIIIAVVSGLVVVILLIMFLFFSSRRRRRLCWRRRRRREEPRNGTEKHSMMDTSAAHVALDSPELTHTDSV